MKEENRTSWPKARLSDKSTTPKKQQSWPWPKCL